MLAFLLSISYFSQVKGKNPSNVFGVAIGGVLFAGIIAFGPYTGGCGNIIRMIGPSLLTGNFVHGITYIVPILTGGCFGAFYYFDNFDEELN